MYKKIIALLVLIPSLALADNSFQANPNQSTIFAQGQFGAAAVDAKGNVFTRVIDPSSGLSQSVIPVSNNTNLNGLAAGAIGWVSIGTDLAEADSSTTVITATSHAARVGDVVQMYSGPSNTNSWSAVSAVTANTITVSNAFPAAPQVGEGFYILRPVPLSANPITGNAIFSSLNVALSTGGQISNATGILKLEDAAHTSGDAGVFALAVQNSNFATFSADLDYTPLATGRAGNILGSLVTDDLIPFTRQAIIVEDAAIPAGAAAVLTAAQAVSAIAQTVGTTGDAAPPSMDLGNRLIVTNAPAGESWQGCGTATASTADVAIKAAVASNRIYTTSITCASSDADNATNINFKDGSTVIAVGGVNQMATTSAGTFTATFTTPLRGTSNTALNFNTAVSTSSVICCAAGYISTI